MFWTIIKKGGGLFFNITGLTWAIFDRFMCKNFCTGAICTNNPDTCSMLFLFVSIILIVVGYTLINMKHGRKMKRRVIKHIKRRLR
ncbi:MAG: hypothetical protein WC438_01675 [Candidatus Pacearchaeota archaeon]